MFAAASPSLRTHHRNEKSPPSAGFFVLDTDVQFREFHFRSFWSLPSFRRWLFAVASTSVITHHRNEKSPPSAGFFDLVHDAQFSDLIFRSIWSLPSLRCRMRAGTGNPSTTQARYCLLPSVWVTLVASRCLPPISIVSLPLTV